ncbi:hypothetical protein LR48_Vigan238s000100 [Vigna angularis]|uniref:Homeobox domain-containing protein n=1 Tax=Phaseolus angularis TaxID=3914 RepID=A0A0L9T6G5_PHAAN|nr:hypothetical protein LR48_Vigan238s000100 [Vigna angularis]
MNEMEMDRYTSQRWRPTDDQVRMMTNIYNYGVTHPSRAQVVEIASRLRVFADVSEYNVHCWFNNHGNRVRRWQAEIDPTGTQFSQLPLYMYEYDWVIMRAPRLLDLFPVPIIIDDDRDGRQIAPPMLLTFRTRAPSTELSLRPPQPAREYCVCVKGECNCTPQTLTCKTTRKFPGRYNMFSTLGFNIIKTNTDTIMTNIQQR